MKIGIMGGTFDPIHFGHLKIAQKALEQCCLDEVILMPTSQPPHKTLDSILASKKDRYEMVRLATRHLPYLSVSDLEMNTKGPAYTIDTIETLARERQAEYYLIMGEDSWKNFETWKDFSKIKQKTKIVVAGRKLKNDENVSEREDCIRLRMENCPISSSEIRKAIERGEKVSEGLPLEVLIYIQEHKLYGWHAVCR